MHLAQVNIGRILAPMDSPVMAEFKANLDPVNALAEAAPGFVWRLQSGFGNATDIVFSEDPFELVNTGRIISNSSSGAPSGSKRPPGNPTRFGGFRRDTSRPLPRRKIAWSTTGNTAPRRILSGFPSRFRNRGKNSRLREGGSACRRFRVTTIFKNLHAPAID